MNRLNQEPFFIVGCGRSGTTLLRGLLNGHPDLGIPQESLFIIDYLVSSPGIDLSVLKPLLIREPELEEWGIHPTMDDLEDCASAAEAISKLHQIYLVSRGKRRWGQKTPRFVRFMGLLLEHFPDSRFIHLIRDPRAVVSSLITSDVHRSNAFFGARRWLKDVSLGLASEERFPGRVLRVRYEELVTEVEASLRSISRFLGFDYEPSMMREAGGGATEYSRFYAAIHANLSLPPTDRFVDKWKEQLSRNEVALVEAIDGALMVQLGYERSIHPPPAMPDLTAAMQLGRAWGLLMQSVQYLRFRRRYLFHLISRKWRLGLLRDFIGGVNY